MATFQTNLDPPIRDESGIIEVYADNFVSEIKRMSALLSTYNYIGMDTEFPGTVYELRQYTPDFYYQTMKLNIDSLKLIQIGITLLNKKGECPKKTHTWQFNLNFDFTKDKYSHSSLNLLVNCGIDFQKLKKQGINHEVFAEYLMVSGLVLNPNIHWVSFHGSYDFGYLLRMLLNAPLPNREEDFTKELCLYFPNHYDIRIMVQGNEQLQGGLNRLADVLEVMRIGKIHQAGSDSIVTIDVFFKLLKSNLVEPDCLEVDKNILFGLGLGADDFETINYTQFSNENFFNSPSSSNPDTSSPLNNPMMNVLNNINGYNNVSYYFKENNRKQFHANKIGKGLIDNKIAVN